MIDPEDGDDGDATTFHRRPVLVGLAGIGTAGLAGCLRLSSGNDSEGTRDADGTATPGVDTPVDEETSTDGTTPRTGTEPPDDAGTSTSGRQEETTTDGDTQVSGALAVTSDPAVAPITRAVASEFAAEHDSVSFEVERVGTDTAIRESFAVGNADLLGASRPLTDEERAQCRDGGFEPLELPVAVDPLTVVVNVDNDWVGGLYEDQLEAIWTAAGSAETWDDADADWPDEEIELYGPSATTGSFEYFARTVLGGPETVREDFEGTVAYDEIVAAVEGSTFALGYLPFAYYANSPDAVQAVPVSVGGVGPTDPTLETAARGAYPLSRPLYVYVNSSRLERRKHLQEFVLFFVERSTSEALFADELGYVPSSPEQADENLETIEPYVE